MPLFAEDSYLSAALRWPLHLVLHIILMPNHNNSASKIKFYGLTVRESAKIF